jgi:hypothetical protein
MIPSFVRRIFRPLGLVHRGESLIDISRDNVANDRIDLAVALKYLRRVQ